MTAETIDILFRGNFSENTLRTNSYISRTVYLVCLLSLSLSCANASDNPKRRPVLGTNNSIEFSRVYYQLWKNQLPFRLKRQVNICYTRFIKKDFFFRLDYVSCYRGGPREIKSFDDWRPGDVEYISFRSVRLGFGKRMTYKNLCISPYGLLSYRWGFGESIFIAKSPNSVSHRTYTDINRMNSKGLGAGCSFGYIIKKRVPISIEYDFMHNFETFKYDKLKYISRSNNYGYSPHKQYSTYHFKIGLIF
jgi:hypothetical protein